MKKSKHRISQRVLRRFLQLAAATFAIGAGAAPASADGGEARLSSGQLEDRAAASYQHSFLLPSVPAALMPHQARAHVRVLDASGRKLTQLALHGASSVGPLADGAYTVLIKADGLTEVHRIRVGPDTLPFLRFDETA
jgi:hypothetical protein